MSFYATRILPHLIDWSMRHEPLVAYRQRLVGTAEGRVLEIGSGSGANLTFYSPGASEVIALDPSSALLMMAAKRGSANVNVRWVEGTAEAIPLESGSIDTVVTTWTMCSIADVGRALHDVRRVLKASGRLLFVEHGRAPDAAVRRWQDRLTPVWRRVAGGCHLNRPVDRLIQDAGFSIEALSTGYMQGLRPMTFMYEGSARPR